MIVPFSTGSLYQVASVSYTPNYEVDISHLYTVASTAISTGASYGSLYIYLVGTDKNGSTWNLAAAKFVFNNTTGSFIYYLAFNGSANYPSYPFYYVNPGTGELDVPVYWVPLASMNDTATFALGINNQQIVLKVNGSQVFTTTVLQKPITLTGIYAYAALSTGSALQDLAAFTLDVKQTVNVFGIIPDVIAGVVAVTAIIMLVRALGVLRF